MDVLLGLPNAIAGERVVASLPPVAPYVRPGASDGIEDPLRKRLNWFAHRTLSHVALTDQQRSRGADLSLLGRAVAAGVVGGFEVALEPSADAVTATAQLLLLPGHAIAPDGSDIELGYPLRVPYRELPVFSPVIDGLLRTVVEAVPGARYEALSALEKLVTIERLASPEIAQLGVLPHAMVLVAMPRSVVIDRADTGASPCANVTDDNAYADLSWEDGFQLAWVPWPADASLPPWTSDGGLTTDPRFRNRLAYAIFNNERERASPGGLRSMRAWNERQAMSEADRAALTQAERAARARTWPWETLGVPLAVVGFDAAHRPVFADRNAVVRQGGGRHNRSALVARAGEDVLWQARVAQLVEQFAEQRSADLATARSAAGIAAQFDWLPPAGVLPIDAIDLVAGRQAVFPANFDVTVQPIALDMADALIAEAAPLLPFNLSLPEQVQVLVPVPSRFYDPNLLDLAPAVNPLFDRELARLAQSRADLLGTRDALRRRFDVLSQAVSGALPTYAQDDPDALPDETGAFDAAFFARVHGSRAEAGQTATHGFADAASRLHLQAADALVFFVRVDTAPAGLAIALQGVEGSLPALTWGELPASDDARLALGPVPAAGAWQRLVVPLRALNRSSLDLMGLGFSVSAGAAPAALTWGYAGKLSNGRETHWLSDAVPVGATVSGTWDWQAQGRAVRAIDDPGFGLPIGSDQATAGVRQVAELDNLVAAYRHSAAGLVREMGVAWAATDASGRPLDAEGRVIPAGSATPQSIRPADQPPLIEQGLTAFIARMGARAAATDDHAEIGFLRARTDIYRVRQNVLGTDKAGQLLTSPAASELIDRSVSIVATEKTFDEYFTRAQQAVIPAAPGPSVIAPPAPAVRAGPASRATTAALGSSSLSMTSGFNASATIRPGTIAAPAPAFSTPIFVSPTLTSPVLAPIQLTPIATTVPLTGLTVTSPTATGIRPGVSTTAVGSIGLVSPGLQIPGATITPTVGDVTGTSLFSTTFNTVTVGQRLGGSSAVETKNAAAAGKSGFVTNSFALLRGNGISIDGIDVYGYKDADDPAAADASKAMSAVQASSLLSRGKLLDFDAQDPGPADQHESGYFIRGLEAIDSMVRFLRGVELRAGDYRRLQRDAGAARDRILQTMQRLQSLSDGLAQQLAETRHDLAAARALLAEERARIAALVAQRIAILQNDVPYLIFRRPRLTNTMSSIATLAAQPAEVANPVPGCRTSHPELPPELQAMVDSLRDLPARWFRATGPIFAAIDRLEPMQRIVDVAALRLRAAPAPRAIGLIEGTGTVTGIALGNAFARHAQRIAASHAPQTQALAGFEATSLRLAITPARRIASLGDLIVALPPIHLTPRAPTLSAAGLLDDVAGVAACLYAGFGAVPPATRLRWAERFSEVDPAFSLHSLTVLPGFGDESLGVDFIAWRGLQSLVDWLFGSIENDDDGAGDASAAINDLVRVCLLLASHAPVKRLLDARVLQPVRPEVGRPLILQLDPRVARIGMQVLVHAPGGSQALSSQVIARAVIDDIGSSGASATFTQVMLPGTVIDAASRVQLQSGPALSTPQQQASDLKAAQAAVNASAAPRAASGISAVATGRLGRQVNAFAGFKR